MTEEQKLKMKLGREAKLKEQEGKKEEFITKEEFSKKFDSLEGSVLKLVEMMSQSKVEQVKEETITTKEISDAKANQTPVNPIWEEKAKEILGNLLDHCEIFYAKEGGTYFTVIIKKEYSNAPKDYLDRMKDDRRTKEVSREGLEGVSKWCTLIKQNLKK